MADPPSLPTLRVPLNPPSLDDVAAAIHSGLKSNFATAHASVSVPPDLRQAPFHLAGPGLSGSPRIADVGGTANLRPSPSLDKKYDLVTISKLMDMPQEGGLLLGAGAGPFFVLGVNTELMPNIAWGSASQDGQLNNCTHYAQVVEGDQVLCQKIEDSTGFGLMCNLLGCDGQTGPLIHVTAKGRTGKLNFTEAIQKAIGDGYGERLISVGGVFVIRSGKVKMHVMPDFPRQPFQDDKDVDRWLRFYDMQAPIVCLSALHAGDDGDLNLRREHTHCFGAPEGPNAGQTGGHYHFDLDETMDVVEYEGWFNVAEVLYRIDPTRP